jgi:hypothetical protein
VRPILECVVANTDGTITAYYGYESKEPNPVTIPVGPANQFAPTPADRGQPTTFDPGTTPVWPSSAFFVTFSGASLSWTLNGITVTADANTTPCAYNIFIEKVWLDLRNRPAGVPSNLPSNYNITVTSSLGTAVCTYPTGTAPLVCVYDNDMPPATDNDGLWVLPGESYVVAENNLPPGTAPISGVGTFNPTDGYCVPGQGGVERYCTHRVNNRVGLPSFTALNDQ